MRHSLPTFAAGSLPSWHILITVWTCPFVGSLVPYFHIANRRAVHRSSMFAMFTSYRFHIGPCAIGARVWLPTARAGVCIKAMANREKQGKELPPE